MWARSLRHYGVPPLAGALLALAFAPFEQSWLAILCPALLWYSLQDSRWPKGFLQGWLFGVGLFGAGASWVYVSIHVYGNASPPLAGFLTLLFVAGIALFPALSTALYARATSTSADKGFQALVFISTWVLGEWFRSWFLTGFPWLYVGNALIDTTLAGYAPVFGVFGLSLLGVTTGVALAFLLMQHHRLKAKTLQLLIPGVALIWLIGWLLQFVDWTRPVGEPLTAGLLQPDIAQETKWVASQRQNHLQKILRLQENLRQTELVIWPETALPLIEDQAPTLLQQLGTRSRQSGQGILTGILTRRPTEAGTTAIYNSMLGLGEAEGEYHKQKLVPFGEYVPLAGLLRGLIAFFDLPMSDMTTAPTDQLPLRFRSLSVQPYICYEIVYPAFVAESAGDAQIMVTVSNDTWFGTSIGPLQHFEIARMRALENRKPLLRATNNGVSAFIGPNGAVEGRLPQFEPGTLIHTIQPREGKTPFNRWENLPVLLICLLLPGFAYRRRVTR